MIKRTLYFGNPHHLSAKLKQLIITNKETGEVKQTPIEDLGFVILDHHEITFTQSMIQELSENNTALIVCNDKHHPASLMLPLDSNQVQAERFSHQISASEPLKKQLWQQTVKSKILNQSKLLDLLGKNGKALHYLATQVKSGDSSNEEAQASRRYWKELFELPNFKRDRFGDFPNPLLNYGYAILRAAVARGLVGSGLLPTLGIHHHNKYNAYALADDIMEPYRPFVDKVVVHLASLYPDENELTKPMKTELINVLNADILINSNRSPLMVGLSQTTASLARCFAGEEKKIVYPELI
ncbi:type II CRISPR-associated endonuclease Cas1 [bacterium]|nr:type II CRISPR-associated endonuclease Cas1 [bacterium]